MQVCSSMCSLDVPYYLPMWHRLWLLLDWKSRLVKIVVDLEKKDKVSC